MKDFKMLREVCLREVEAAGIVPGKIVEWSVNSRSQKRWGQCTKDRRTGECKIQIAERLLTDDRISVKDCKDTIVHEILHTCEGCKGHTGLWKKYAQRMNDLYGYNIKRVTAGEEKGVENYQSISRPYRYIFKCAYCGRMILKKRACKFTHYYKNYTCTRCGAAHAFIRIK